MARWLGSKEAVGGDYPSSSRSRHFHLAEEALDLLTSYGPTKKSALITELFLKRSGKGGAIVQNEKAQQFSLALVDSTARELLSLKRQGRPTKEHPIARQVIFTIVADAVSNRPSIRGNSTTEIQAYRHTEASRSGCVGHASAWRKHTLL